MRRCFFKVAGGKHRTLIPSDKNTEDVLRKYKHGDIISFPSPRKPRNPKHNAKYWALLNLIHEGTAVQDLYPTTNKLHYAIKGALGYYSEVELPDGKVFKIIDSTAYENMDQEEFDQFYNKAVDLIVTQVVPNLNREDLVREVEKMTK